MKRTTGTKTGKAEDFFPPLPEDHDLYKRGWIVGESVSTTSHTATSSPSQRMSEEEIAVAKEKLRKAGYGTIEQSFMESVARGMFEQPKATSPRPKATAQK